MSQLNSQIASFGKIIFVPTYESIPALPEMNLLFFNEEEAMFPWRAVCIDLEIDACGASMNLARENLKTVLTTYIAMEKKAAGDCIITAAKNITETAFDKSEQKRRYTDIYRQAEKECIMQKIESGKASDPITEKKECIKKLEAEHGPIRFVITDLQIA
jgi:hypothetical protein